MVGGICKEWHQNAADDRYKCGGKYDRDEQQGVKNANHGATQRKLRVTKKPLQPQTYAEKMNMPTEKLIALNIAGKIYANTVGQT